MSLALFLLCVCGDGMGRRPWENRGGCCWSHGFPQIERGELGHAWPALLTELHIMLILQASPCCTPRDSAGHMDEGYQAFGLQKLCIHSREMAARFKAIKQLELKL